MLISCRTITAALILAKLQPYHTFQELTAWRFFFGRSRKLGGNLETETRATSLFLSPLRWKHTIGRSNKQAAMSAQTPLLIMPEGAALIPFSDSIMYDICS
jgi:hypothetical protein